MSNLKTSVYSMLEEFLGAEKITRDTLKQLSRDLLVYVPDSHDVDIVNRLITGATPVNRKALIMFFKEFLPWEAEMNGDEFSRFGKMIQGDKKVAKKMASISEFLEDENNNFWTWAERHVKVDKVPDYLAQVERAIENALKGNEKKDVAPANPVEVAFTVLHKLTPDQLMAAIQHQQKALEEMAAQHKVAEAA